ncbi:MAG: hypothetical protein QXV81_08190 [Ignisphaera sp.]
MNSYESEIYRFFAFVIIVAITCLTILALCYWIIMKQDSTVLTTVSALIGGVAGYYLKALKEKL